MVILGVSGGPRGSHEPGVALLVDGVVKWALIEERHNRYKTSVSCFPHRSLETLFKRCGVDPKSIDVVAHPGITYDDMKIRWPMYLDHNFGIQARHYVPVNHQMAHLASAYFYSDLTDALVLTLDGVGDRLSGMVATGEGHRLVAVDEFSSKDSVGFFWHILCQYIGYEPLEEAYKMMGLAAYGNPRFDLSPILSFRDGKVHFDYSFMLDKWDFISKHSLERFFSGKLESFFDFPPRRVLEPLRPEDRDIAASAQKHLEAFLYEMCSFFLEKYQKRSLVLAGGVSLNSKAVGELNRQLPLDRFFVTPFPSDGGLALGSALYAHASLTEQRPAPIISPFLGLEYGDDETLKQIEFSGLPYRVWQDLDEIAKLLQGNCVLGVHQGRSEYGPRALGARSILASPILKDMKDLVNQKIKFREEFRPFAPATRDVDFDEYFERGSGDYSYMSFTIRATRLASEKCPAVVHIDGTSRAQEVTRNMNPFFYDLLGAFKKATGVGVLLNTSFNLKGEPIVESPSDAIRTFVSSGLDHLVIGKYLVSKPRTAKPSR